MNKLRWNRRENKEDMGGVGEERRKRTCALTYRKQWGGEGFGKGLLKTDDDVKYGRGGVL